MNTGHIKNENGDTASPQDKSDTKATRAYERSTIEFPYNDLDDAVSIAKAIHMNAGMSCTLDQLAAYLGQSMTSGAFRGRVSNAGTFRLTENERGGVRLSDLGLRAVDENKEPEARADAFLSVPLYLEIYEKYRGYTLPPAAALEREMLALGVSSKQTNKARQAFMRSAKQAGFFTHGEDRLVKPAFGATPTTKPIKSASGEEKPKGKGEGGSGGGDNVGLNLDPLIIELLRKIPPADKGWPVAKRLRWMRTFAMNVSQIYDDEDQPVEFKIEIENSTSET